MLIMETKKEIEKMIDELCQLDQAIQDGRKIEKTSLCKEAAEVLKAIFHIQDQEHKTIIRDESKIKTNEVEKKRSGKWIKPVTEEGKATLEDFRMELKALRKRA